MSGAVFSTVLENWRTNEVTGAGDNRKPPLGDASKPEERLRIQVAFLLILGPEASNWQT